MATHPTRDDIDLLDGSFYVDDPHEKYTWMRENAPVYFDAENGVWGIASYAALLAMEKDPTTFSNAGGIRPDNGPIPMMIDMDDPEHWKRRKVVNKGFTPRRVRDSEQKIRDTCDAIIDQVCERGECDFVSDIAAPLPMILIGDMLGVEPADRGDLLRWSDDMVSAQSGNATDEQYVKAMDAMVGYSAFCEHAVAQRHAQPTDDLMSVLVHAEVDGDRLSPDDVLHESLLILVGGDETTRHVISGGVEQLLLQPDQRQLLVDDPSKITVAVEEMLRWVTPIKNMCRTVTHDTEFMGQQLLEGQIRQAGLMNSLDKLRIDAVITQLDQLIERLSSEEGVNSQDFFKFAASANSLRARISRLRRAGYTVHTSRIEGTGTGIRHVNYRIIPKPGDRVSGSGQQD